MVNYDKLWRLIAEKNDRRKVSLFSFPPFLFLSLFWLFTFRLCLNRKIRLTPYAHHFQHPYKRHAGNCTSGDRATSTHIKCIPLTNFNYIECTLCCTCETPYCDFYNFYINRFKLKHRDHFHFAILKQSKIINRTRFIN